MNPRSLPESNLATLRAWFDIAPDAMIAVGQNGDIVLANAQAERMFGYAEAGGLKGMPVDAMLPEALRGAHARHRRQYLAAPRMRPMGIGQELTGLRRDGQTFPVEIGLSPITIDAGIITIASLRDIAETRRVRQALERARHDAFAARISRLVLESLDYGSAIQRIPELVASALEVPAVAILSSGRQRDTFEIRAATGLSALTAEVLAAIFGNGEFVHRAFEDGNRTPFTSGGPQTEAAAIVRSGLARTRYRRFAMVPLFGRYEPLGVLIALGPAGAGFDADEVAFLQSVSHVLTATVQRSHAEEQLAHSQRLDAVGQLTGGIAHDFNNLLTVVSGNLQLLEMELSDRPQLGEIIDGALRAVDRGAELTRKLLTFARRQSLLPRAVRPGPLLDELGRMLKRTLGETIDVRIDDAKGVPAVYADPNELDTALVNLALNARDAMPRGGQLTITAFEVAIDATDQERNLAPGRYVGFNVGDTGIGMPEDVRIRAVEPFFTTKDSGKGSGLGLSMVYGFVTQSGGWLGVDSQLGYGTRVEFLLPAATGESVSYAEPADPETPDACATVLVVEDEAEVRAIAARFLRKMGYEVLTASDANEALQVLAAQSKVDLLFSDVVLGGSMTGVELAHEARRQYPGLAVLLVSGYPGSTSGPRDTDTTATFPLLRKPYRREQLGDAVRAALDSA